MNFLEELDLLIRARYPILNIITSEEQRVRDAIVDIAGARKKRSSSGVANTGIVPAGDIAPVHETPGHLPQKTRWSRWIRSSARLIPRFSFHNDFSPVPDAQPPVRCSQAQGNRPSPEKYASRRLSSSPAVLEIPPELEKEITVLNFPLPTHADLGALLDRIIADLTDANQSSD